MYTPSECVREYLEDVASTGVSACSSSESGDMSTVADTPRPLWNDIAQVPLKNTFIHIAPRLDERRFASAPAGVDIAALLALDSLPPRKMVWADEVDSEDEGDDGIGEAIETARCVVMEHLAVASGGMSLSTIGNRIPKHCIKAFKQRGLRMSEVVHGWAGVEVVSGVVRLIGAAKTKDSRPSYNRGEFRKRMQRGEVNEQEAEDIYKVLRSVYDLVESADGQQSIFALGNWLAAGCRAFLKSCSLRLLELLREFPDVFRCPSVGSKLIVRLAPDAVLSLETVQARLWGMSCSF
mmetsp:Transcript_45417/g.102804  ORF Transcript_45417/g.102804 Transcript_45417/m.102804 type:complete len:294 (-) Transcript_45417:1030-1911(-)